MTEPVLSILICTLPDRSAMLGVLLLELQRQIREEAPDVVEILFERHPTDNTGMKRNRLLEEAIGKYIIFVDDDDWIAPTYISEILSAANNDTDCISINGIYTEDGANPVMWRMGKDYPNETADESGVPVFIRAFNHIGAAKRGLALMARFPDNTGHGEDKQYSENIKPWLKTETRIENPIYFYRFKNGYKEYLKY